jgi:hypothetical protein
MYATHRCYEGIEESQLAELTRKIDEGLIPRLSKLPGFDGYFLLEGGEGMLRSISLFETFSQAEDSTRVAAEWTREEGLESRFGDPEVTVRKVFACVRKAPLLV